MRSIFAALKRKEKAKQKKMSRIKNGSSFKNQ